MLGSCKRWSEKFKFLNIQMEKLSTMNPLQSFSIKLSAPGKVILFGEYSVVFNKPAIAATLCLRTNLFLRSTTSPTWQLHFSALDIQETFHLEDVQECFGALPTDTWDTYLQSMTEAFDCLCEKRNGLRDLTEAQKLSLMAFFHCFARFSSSGGFSLKIESELPIGSGVGSSASFSVVLSAAALLFERCGVGLERFGSVERKETGEVMVSEKLLGEISELAFSCERIFHGSPSGVDHTTILRGAMLEFRRLDGNKNKITSIDTSGLKILLVNTNVPRSTKKNVANVKKLNESHPEIIGSVLDGMENVVKSAVKCLVDLKESRGKTKPLETHFGELVSLNHGLLRVLGTSHPALELIVSTAHKYGLHAKLTGGGGGGFGFIYIPSDVDSSVIDSVGKELTVAGLTVYDVSLGGPGLVIDEIIF